MKEGSSSKRPTAKEEQDSIAERDVAVDFLKGVLIALMIYGHSARVGSMRVTWEYVVEWIYSFHMPAFLIVSGYYFMPRLQGKEILEPLLRRLALPYVIFVILYLVGLIAARWAGFSTSNAPPESITDFLESVFLNGAGALWFIHALIVMQLIFALSRHASNRLLDDKGALWFLAICLSGVAVFLGVIKDWVALYFLVGLALSQMKEKLKTNVFFSIPAAVIFIMISQGTPIDLSLVQIGWVLSVVGTVMCFSTLAPEFLASLFAWLGRNTLIFLVSHALFTVSLKPFAGVLTALEPTGVIFSGVVLTVTLAGGLTIARLVDATGLSPYLFGVRRLYVPFAQVSSTRLLMS